MTAAALLVSVQMPAGHGFSIGGGKRPEGVEEDSDRSYLTEHYPGPSGSNTSQCPFGLSHLSLGH